MGYINDQGEYVNESRGNRGSGGGSSNGNIFVRMTKFIIVKRNEDQTVNTRSTLVSALIALLGTLFGIQQISNSYNPINGIFIIIASIVVAILYEFISRKQGLLTFLLLGFGLYIGFTVSNGNIISALMLAALGWSIGYGLEKLNNIKYRK